MTRRLLVLLAASGAFVGAGDALAAGPMPFPDPAGGHLVPATGSVLFAVTPHATSTEIRAERPSGQLVWRTTLPGRYGTTMLTMRGAHGGVSRTGSVLVLPKISEQYPAPQTTFAIVATAHPDQPRYLRLRDDWAFDALSPDGRVLYLIQHVGDVGPARYRVRAVDLPTLRLRPRVIADQVAHEWTMAGSAVSRAVSRDGRFVYTLYWRPDGKMFVHALNAARATARCIDLPWNVVSGEAVSSLELRLDGGRRELRVQNGTLVVARIDTRTARVLHAVARV